MKVFLFIFIFALFVLFALFVYFKYLFRIYIFEDIVLLTKHLKNSIVFSKDCLDTLFNKISGQFHNITKKYLSNKDDFILNSGDNEMVKRFFCSLGHGDVCYEISNLNYYENLFIERLNFHKENLKIGNLYLKLIIGLGILVIILLI